MLESWPCRRDGHRNIRGRELWRAYKSAIAQECRDEKQRGPPPRLGSSRRTVSAKFRASFHCDGKCTRCASVVHLKKAPHCTFCAHGCCGEDLCNSRAMRLMLLLSYENLRGRAESRNRCSCRRKFDRYRLGKIFRESCFKSVPSLIQQGVESALVAPAFRTAIRVTPRMPT
jgi:hypothetical protein